MVRVEAGRLLLGDLDSLGKSLTGNPVVKSLDSTQQQAYEMILGDAGKAFVLTDEKNEVRDRYGRTKFGQSCLLARRLVERGVPFITINDGGWDTHKQHFETMRRKLPELDALTMAYNAVQGGAAGVDMDGTYSRPTPRRP